MISQYELKKRLRYDPLTGIWTWLMAYKSSRIGQVAGSYTNGYIMIQIDDESYSAHRLAWLYMTGKFPKVLIDHKDLNPSNNAWDNLREATYAQNAQNKGLSKRNKTGVKGVFWHKNHNKFHATIRANNRTYNLGDYDTL